MSAYNPLPSVVQINLTSIDPSPILSAYLRWHSNMNAVGVRPSAKHDLIASLITENMKFLHYISGPEGTFSVMRTGDVHEGDIDDTLAFLIKTRARRALSNSQNPDQSEQEKSANGETSGENS